MDTHEPAPSPDDEPTVTPRAIAHDTAVKRAEGLLSSINEAAANARNLFVTLLLFMLYLAITAASTTDEQLLRDSAIAVPLLPAANVPASSFYGIAPLLLLILHLEVLLNLDRLAAQIKVFRGLSNDVGEHDLPYLHRQLSSFQMVQWSLGANERPIRILTGAIMFLTTAAAPLLILLFLQYAFLPFHSTPITALQRGVVALDAILILAFWPRLLHTRHDPHTRAARVAWPLRNLLGPWWLLPISAVFVSLLILRLPDDAFERFLSCHARGGPRAFGLDDRICPKASSDKKLIDVFAMPLNAGLDLHRSLVLYGLDLSSPPALPEIAGALRSGKDSEIAVALKKVNGLDLTGRDLRRADFGYALIPKIKLQGANLESANFGHASLLGTDMGGNFRHAHFNDTKIYQSHFKSASMLLVSFANATISSTTFEGNFIGTSFDGSKISDSDFDKADASASEFINAEITASRFNHAILIGARFQNCLIARSSFQRAILNAARFEGTAIESSDFGDAEIKLPEFKRTSVSLSRFLQIRDGVCEDALAGNRYFPNHAAASFNFIQQIDRTPLTELDLDNLRKTPTAIGEFTKCQPSQLFAANTSNLLDGWCSDWESIGGVVRANIQQLASQRRKESRCDAAPISVRDFGRREAALLEHVCKHDDHRSLTNALEMFNAESETFKRRLATVAGNPKNCPGVAPVSPKQLEKLLEAN